MAASPDALQVHGDFASVIVAMPFLKPSFYDVPALAKVKVMRKLCNRLTLTLLMLTIFKLTLPRINIVVQGTKYYYPRFPASSLPFR